MLYEYLLALLLPPAMLLAWVGVQHAWRRQFPMPRDEADALAARGDCGQCGCRGGCRRETDTDRMQTRRSRS